jgi:hypothetical protein
LPAFFIEISKSEVKSNNKVFCKFCNTYFQDRHCMGIIKKVIKMAYIKFRQLLIFFARRLV